MTQMQDNAGALRSKTGKHFHLAYVLVFPEDVLVGDHCLDPLDIFVRSPNTNLSGKLNLEHLNLLCRNGMQLTHCQILFWFPRNLDLSGPRRLEGKCAVIYCIVLLFASLPIGSTWEIWSTKSRFPKYTVIFPFDALFLNTLWNGVVYQDVKFEANK